MKIGAGCCAQGSCGCPITGSVKARLDVAQSNLVWWKVSLPMTEWVD